MLLRSKTISIPLYFEKINIQVYDKLENKPYAACVEFTKKAIVLTIKQGASVGIIAHEATHIVNFVFRQCHIDLDAVNDEPQAYLTGWIVEQIYKFVNASK